ncbi:MAG: hypothetical protein M1834_005742 [Cirrosporium novae-zelandiae]|nr:MAG: hypothetical protein M1834_005742 [Cirrosporium novae-zelandiae]
MAQHEGQGCDGRPATRGATLSADEISLFMQEQLLDILQRFDISDFRLLQRPQYKEALANGSLGDWAD